MAAEALQFNCLPLDRRATFALTQLSGEINEQLRTGALRTVTSPELRVIPERFVVLPFCWRTLRAPDQRSWMSDIGLIKIDGGLMTTSLDTKDGVMGVWQPKTKMDLVEMGSNRLAAELGRHEDAVFPGTYLGSYHIRVRDREKPQPTGFVSMWVDRSFFPADNGRVDVFPPDMLVDLPNAKQASLQFAVGAVRRGMEAVQQRQLPEYISKWMLAGVQNGHNMLGGAG